MIEQAEPPVGADIALRSPYLPAIGVDDARAAMIAYQELCAAILVDDDWIGRPGEPESFVKRSGWDKLANFYGASVELLGDTILERDADGALTRAAARARATGRDGRFREAGGACGRNEPRFVGARGRQKIEHDLPATAETRAVNRAIASLVGFGAVSAEEVDGDVRAGGGPNLPPWAADVLDRDDVAERFGNGLATILAAAGDEAALATANELAQRLVRYCDGTLPAATARLARLLVQALPVPFDEAEPDVTPVPPEGDADDAPVSPEGDTTPPTAPPEADVATDAAAGAPDIPPEGATA